jgi:hypothetical protein
VADDATLGLTPRGGAVAADKVSSGAPTTEVDPNGKLLWDVVAMRLAAQTATQAVLVSRAKDLLGVATIVATISGVILNDKLFYVQKAVPPWPWTVLAVIALIAVFGGGLAALLPGRWSSAPDAVDFHAVEQQYSHATYGEFYRSLAEGFLLPGADGSKSRLVQNDDRLAWLARFVNAQVGGLVLLGVLAFLLAFFVDIEAPTTT